MSVIKSLKKLFKSLKAYSKTLYTDIHFREFGEKYRAVIKLIRKRTKQNIKHSEKIKIEAIYNKLITLKARVDNVEKNNDISVKKGQSAFKNRISTTLFVNHKHKNLDSFFAANESLVTKLLRKRIKKFNCVKIGVIFVGKFAIRDRVEIKYIYNSTKLLTKSADLSDFYRDKIVLELKTNLENFEANGSDPRLVEILNLTVNVNKCNPLRAAGFIELPQFVTKRKAVYNVRNQDDYCFLWCLLKKFYPNHKFNKESNKKTITEKRHKEVIPVFQKYFKLTKFSFPMQLKSINKCSITMPDEKHKYLYFKNYKNQIFNPYVVYYDSESILKKCNNEKAYQEHQIHSMGLYVVNRWDEKKSYYKSFSGDDVVLQFMKELEKLALDIEEVKKFLLSHFFEILHTCLKI